jgi:hypothetical protein
MVRFLQGNITTARLTAGRKIYRIADRGAAGLT